jgi:hypothetical protein
MVLEEDARILFDRDHISYSFAFADNADPLQACRVELRVGVQRIRPSALPLPRIKF